MVGRRTIRNRACPAVPFTRKLDPAEPVEHEPRSLQGTTAVTPPAAARLRAVRPPDLDAVAGLTSKLAARWTLDLSANWSRSDGKAALFSPPGGTPDVAVGFDNYDNVKLFILLGQIDYQITPSAWTGLFARWEDYKIDSFVLQGLQNYLPGALLLNPSYGDYRGSILGLDMTLTF